MLFLHNQLPKLAILRHTSGRTAGSNRDQVAFQARHDEVSPSHPALRTLQTPPDTTIEHDRIDIKFPRGAGAANWVGGARAIRLYVFVAVFP